MMLALGQWVLLSPIGMAGLSLLPALGGSPLDPR